jgi:glycosyltransferase involved in cell wall biosynthesis
MGPSDLCIICNASIVEVMAAFVSKCVLRRRGITILWDLLLQPPTGPFGRLQCKLRSVLLCGVEKLFCVHKDTSGYQSYYGIPESKFVHIPFKANNIDVTGDYAIGDDGYVLACGASWRDYKTFIAAIKEVGVPAKIVLPGSSVSVVNNTFLKEDNIPENVKVIRHNLDQKSWNQYIAMARLVVIPIRKEAIQAAGISTYLEAMAMGKAVVISEGVSTKGLLTNQAEIVPPANVPMLAGVIRRLWNDDQYRSELALRGKNYAQSLGNETRLVKDILRNAIECVRL